jgi:hypothetical protein
MTSPALARLDALAADVGRLRRRYASSTDARAGTFFLDLIAGHVQALDALLRPTAAKVYAANLWLCGDEQVSVTAALADADARTRHLRSLLGERER